MTTFPGGILHDDAAASTMFSGGLTFSPGPEQDRPHDVLDESAPDAHRDLPLGDARDLRRGVPSNHRTIVTEAGRYLRAVAQDEPPAHPGPVDDAARRVWAIAFGLMTRRRFETDAPLAEIGRTVAAAVHEHALAALPMLDVEMLIRDALGEPVPTGEIDPVIAAGVHVLVFASIADELALGEAEVDGLIAEAEALAV